MVQGSVAQNQVDASLMTSANNVIANVASSINLIRIGGIGEWWNPSPT